MERVITSSQEEQLIQIVQTLPVELMAKVVEFAESLQRQLNNSKSHVILGETADLVHEDEAEWDKQFASSTDILQQLADKALANHRAGKTFLLDPDKL